MSVQSSPAIRLGINLKKLSLILLMLLSFLLPMELDRPWLIIGPLDITNVEICLALVLISAFLLWIYEGRPSFRLPKIWIWLGLTFLVFLFVSAFAATAFSENAFSAAMRTASGIALMLATIITIRTKRDLALVASALAAGALTAGFVGIAEIIRGEEIIWLESFRSVPSAAGGFLRLSGPFDYANQAAMFIEATLPLLAALCVIAWRRQHRIISIALTIGIFLLVQAALLTYSRSAVVIVIVYIFLTFAGFIWSQSRLPSRNNGILLMLGVGALLIVISNLLIDPVWRLRFTSEGDSAWYEAEILAPASIDMIAGGEKLVSITLVNEGEFTWRSDGSSPVSLAARWVHPDSDHQFVEQLRWSLNRVITPGETETMELLLPAPQVSGDFKLIWDLVQEDVTWFGTKTGRETSSAVKVIGGNSLLNEEESLLESGQLVDDWQNIAPIPGRSTLWRIAWDLWRSNYLLGIGLDNFRLRYGEELDAEHYDQTIHTNNWYIEMVVSLGLLGSLPFLAWLAALVYDMIRKMRNGGVWRIAIAAAIFAYLLHGLLDYLLLFNATGLLFWILIGMWVALNYHIEGSESSSA